MSNELEMAFYDAEFKARHPDFVPEAMPAAPTKPTGRGPDAKGGVTEPAMALMDTMAGLLKGSVAATLGLPGDVESLVRLLSGGKQVLPTTEDVQGMLPPVVPAGGSKDRQHTADMAQQAGEFIPLAPVVAARKITGAAAARLSELPAGPVTGGAKSQRGAIGPQTGFEKVPNSLMGFAKSKPNKAFAETKYKSAVFVEVTDEKGNKFYDAIKGMNEKHAIERAKRNWDDGMTVRVISESDAKKVDPDLVREVRDAMPANDRVIRYDASGNRIEAAQ
jgi:hypothetical protein